MPDTAETARPSRLAIFGLAIALIASWSCILLLGFHVFGVMGMFLVPSIGSWACVVAWFGCGTILLSSLITNAQRRDRVLLFGATILLVLALRPLFGGVVISVLGSGWPFGILWLRVARRVWDSRPPQEWETVARQESSPSRTGEELGPNHSPERTGRS